MKGETCLCGAERLLVHCTPTGGRHGDRLESLRQERRVKYPGLEGLLRQNLIYDRAGSPLPAEGFLAFGFRRAVDCAPYLALRHCAFALKMLPSGGCHYAKPFCALARGHLGRRSSATGTVARRFVEI